MPDHRRAGSATLTVSPGYALSPLGDEILVGNQVSRPLVGVGKRSIVAVRYDERLVDPVPWMSSTSEDDTAQFGAVEETYVVEVFQSGPDALDDRWVVLAVLDLDVQGQVVIDTSSRRHLRACP